MASGARAGVGRPGFAAILTGAAMLMLAGSAEAATFFLHQSVFAIHIGGKGRAGRAAPASAERYITDDGRGFVLDHGGGATLIKFEDSPEVWALQPTHGPRGDVIYKNDANETMLRETQMGGVTVFTPRRPDGAPAALEGAGAPLRLATLGPVVLYQRLFQAGVRLSRIAQRVVGFDAPNADAGSDGLIADAAYVVTEAAASVVARRGGRARLARLRGVIISQGEAPGVVLRQGALAITVASARGLAGRPSSDRIASVLLRGH